MDLIGGLVILRVAVWITNRMLRGEADPVIDNSVILRLDVVDLDDSDVVLIYNDRTGEFVAQGDQIEDLKDLILQKFKDRQIWLNTERVLADGSTVLIQLQ